MILLDYILKTCWLLPTITTGIVGIITIFAMIYAPIVALKVQMKIENAKEKNNRKLDIFKTLMATRGDRLSLEHVRALHMIDVEFYGHNEVIDCLRLYQKHLNMESFPRPDTEKSAREWIDKSFNMLIDLLAKMSCEVGYVFDTATLKSIYLPSAHEEQESQYRILRKGLVEIIEKDKPISVNIRSISIENDSSEKK